MLTRHELTWLRTLVEQHPEAVALIDRELRGPRRLLFAPTGADLVWRVGDPAAPSRLYLQPAQLEPMRFLHRTVSASVLAGKPVWACAGAERTGRALRNQVTRSRELIRAVSPALADELTERVEVANAFGAAIYRPGEVAILTADTPRTRGNG